MCWHCSKIHLCSFSHQMLSSLRIWGTSVYEESRKTSSLISRLCLSQSKADIPHGHHKPDPSPLHSRELKWEVKSKGKSWGQQRPPQSTTTGENPPSSKSSRKAKLPLNRLQGGPLAERKELHQIHATALQPTSSSLLTEFRGLGNDSIIRHQRGNKNLILLIAIIPEFVINFLGGKITRKT